jgi:hypothetical protein
MVWWNSKERGVRLGGDTSLGLSVSCTKCNHVACIRLDVALRLWGERTCARDIARDLRCTKCGARQACVQVISDVRPRTPSPKIQAAGLILDRVIRSLIRLYRRR